MHSRAEIVNAPSCFIISITKSRKLQEVIRYKLPSVVESNTVIVAIYTITQIDDPQSLSKSLIVQRRKVVYRK